MSVPVLGPFCVVTISMLHVAVVDGRWKSVYYFLSMESKPFDVGPVLIGGLLGPPAYRWTMFCYVWRAVGLLATAKKSDLDEFAALLGVGAR